MFERSKKAVSLMNRLTAVVALTILALALAPRYNEAYALYIVSDEEYVQVDELGKLSPLRMAAQDKGMTKISLLPTVYATVCNFCYFFENWVHYRPKPRICQAF